MKPDILNKTSLSILFVVGGILHYVGYHLDENTIRDESAMWISMAIPSILGAIYLIVKMRLLRNKTYKKIKGVKRQLIKALICFMVLLASTVLFGGYLDVLVLGSNYLVTGEEKTESFDVIEIIGARPGLQKRTSRTVPLIRFSNESLSDEVKLNAVDFDDFDTDISKIEIVTVKGLWGLGIIRKIEVH